MYFLDSPPKIFIPTHDGIRAYSSSGYGGHSVFSTDGIVKGIDFFISQNATAVLWLDGAKNTINLAAFEGMETLEVASISTSCYVAQAS